MKDNDYFILFLIATSILLYFELTRDRFGLAYQTSEESIKPPIINIKPIKTDSFCIYKPIEKKIQKPFKKDSIRGFIFEIEEDSFTFIKDSINIQYIDSTKKFDSIFDYY